MSPSTDAIDDRLGAAVIVPDPGRPSNRASRPQPLGPSSTGRHHARPRLPNPTPGGPNLQNWQPVPPRARAPATACEPAPAPRRDCARVPPGLRPRSSVPCLTSPAICLCHRRPSNHTIPTPICLGPARSVCRSSSFVVCSSDHRQDKSDRSCLLLSGLLNFVKRHGSARRLPCGDPSRLG